MSASDLSRVISSAVVPVVIISACGLLALAFYNRMTAIISRLRGFQRERLLQLERTGKTATEYGRRLLDQLELQTAHVRKRAQLIRLAIFFLLLTIAVLIGCCLMLGFSALAPKAVYLAFPLFVLGLLSMLGGVIAAGLELKESLHPVEMESQFVSEVLSESIQDDAHAA